MPIIEEARELVAARLDVVREADGRLFTGPRGGRITTAVLRDATHWDEVVTRLGYEHLRRHDLRHTGLTEPTRASRCTSCGRSPGTITGPLLRFSPFGSLVGKCVSRTGG